MKTHKIFRFCHQRQQPYIQCCLPTRFLTTGTASSNTVSAAASSLKEDNKDNKNNFDFVQIRNEIIQNWLDAETKCSDSSSSTKAQYCCFTYNDGVRAYQQKSAKWHWLDRELSSNMAGETGAVYIYKGAMFAMNYVRPRSFTSQAHEFVQEHYQNEMSHLQYFQSIVSDGKYTSLLPLWRMAGWTLGFVPTVVGGSEALYVTVHAVESFVEEHYQDQIQPLRQQGNSNELLRLLEHCCEDEVHHKNDAKEKLLTSSGSSDGDTTETQILNAWWVQPWSLIVRQGSIIAAEIARRI